MLWDCVIGGWTPVFDHPLESVMTVRETIGLLRSGLSFWLLGVAIDLAPACEKASLAAAVHDHCNRCLGNAEKNESQSMG